ncbi:MAG: DUF192 domain-containing protein [Verrucomicrobia bacterium]|nr:DUF192 domain-containing protein [Verrucomicrobiota bacterium]MCH8513937.1 DUF192 domain-containing protein [Kiritimatiellia bacterium]
MNPAFSNSEVSLWQEERCILNRLHVARGFLQRGVGLMFRKSVPEQYGDGLLFLKCRSLHTFNMRFALDMVFLNGAGEILKVRRGVRPWKIVYGPKSAAHVFEVPAGALANLTEDAPIVWRKSE